MSVSQPTTKQAISSIWTNLRDYLFKRLSQQNPLFLPALSICGVGIGYAGSPWGWLLCLIALVWAMRSPNKSLLILVLGLSAIFLWQDDERDDAYRKWQIRQSQVVEIEGTVTKTTKNYALIQTSSGFYYQCKLNDDIKLFLGESYRIKGVANPMKNYHQAISTFDTKQYAYDHGILGKLIPLTITEQTHRTWYGSLLFHANTCRKAIQDYLNDLAGHQSESLQFLQACLLGDTEQAPEEIIQTFKKTGTMHLFAISGLHVGLIAAITAIILTIASCPLRLKLILCLVVVTAYTYVTGMSISALRACFMIDLALLALLLFRKPQLLNIMSFAFIVLLFVDPANLFKPGFQLSFGIVALLLLTGVLLRREQPMWAPNDYIPQHFYSKRQRTMVKIEAWVRSTIVICTVAWLGSILFTSIHFHTWNGWGALTNICIAGLVTLMIGCAMMSLLLFWFPFLASLFLTGALMFSKGILSVTKTMADFPHSISSYWVAAPANQYSILTGAYGQHTIILGNPAWIIHLGSDSFQTYQLTPYLQSQGITPHHLITSKHSRKDLPKHLNFIKQWPDILSHYALHPMKEIHSWKTGNQSLRVLPTNSYTPSLKEVSHIIQWECNGLTLLYTANASYSSLISTWDEVPKVDILILGKHPFDPINDRDLIIKTGAKTVITLQKEPLVLPDTIEVIHLNDHQLLQKTMK